jgi:hypothetical protein
MKRQHHLVTLVLKSIRMGLNSVRWVGVEDSQSMCFAATSLISILDSVASEESSNKISPANMSFVLTTKFRQGLVPRISCFTDHFPETVLC